MKNKKTALNLPPESTISKSVGANKEMLDSEHPVFHVLAASIRASENMASRFTVWFRDASFKPLNLLLGWFDLREIFRLLASGFWHNGILQLAHTDVSGFEVIGQSPSGFFGFSGGCSSISFCPVSQIPFAPILIADGIMQIRHELEGIFTPELAGQVMRLHGTSIL